MKKLLSMVVVVVLTVVAQANQAQATLRAQWDTICSGYTAVNEEEYETAKERFEAVYTAVRGVKHSFTGPTERAHFSRILVAASGMRDAARQLVEVDDNMTRNNVMTGVMLLAHCLNGYCNDVNVSKELTMVTIGGVSQHMSASEAKSKLTATIRRLSEDYREAYNDLVEE